LHFPSLIRTVSTQHAVHMRTFMHHRCTREILLQFHQVVTDCLAPPSLFPSLSLALTLSCSLAHALCPPPLSHTPTSGAFQFSHAARLSRASSPYHTPREGERTREDERRKGSALDKKVAEEDNEETVEEEKREGMRIKSSLSVLASQLDIENNDTGLTVQVCTCAGEAKREITAIICVCVCF